MKTGSLKAHLGRASPVGAAGGISLVVWVAFAANILIALAKYFAAFLTGSSAMLSEAIHSTADTANELLIMLGVKRGQKRPDKRHPFGHGHEIYFWGLIVATVLFGLGGGLSFYEGAQHILDPTPLEDPLASYVVLGLAFFFEGISFVIAARKMRRLAKDAGVSFWTAAHGSKNPEHFVVLFEDVAALLGILVAFSGVYASHYWSMPELDGVASIGIGLILTATALLLAFECKSLLIGESASLKRVRDIHAIVEADPAVERAGPPLTMHLGPKDVLLNLDVQFKADLSTHDIESAIGRLEEQIRHRHHDVCRIFIEAHALGRAESA